jgi:anti-sigma regulatory factor (Ser/Thr protein kinase)
MSSGVGGAADLSPHRSPRTAPSAPLTSTQRCTLRQRMASATGQDIPLTQQTPTAPTSRAARGAHLEVHPFLTGPGTLRLPPVPWAAAVSRRYLRQLLRGWQLAAVAETAELMASELVANAVTAARAPGSGILPDEPQPQSQPIELGVRRTEDSVIIEVTDPNPEPPVLRQAGAMDEGGRGLSIIEMLGSRWGYYPSAGGGKVVWCEIAVDHTCLAGLLRLSMAGYPGLGSGRPGSIRPRIPVSLRRGDAARGDPWEDHRRRGHPLVRWRVPRRSAVGYSCASGPSRTRDRGMPRHQDDNSDARSSS